MYWDENSGVGCQSDGCPSQAESGGVGRSLRVLFNSRNNANRHRVYPRTFQPDAPRQRYYRCSWCSAAQTFLTKLLGCAGSRVVRGREN